MDLLSYPRAVFATIFCAIHTLVWSIFIIGLASIVPSRKTVDWFINTVWCKTMLWVGGIEVEVRGAEHVSGSKKGYLILFNHSSHMDIPVLCAGFPRTFRFGAKIELFRIPFFGRVMKIAGVLPIDRHNRNKVMEVYREAISRVGAGESFALAPEGTRQPVPVLGKFKRGPFEFAINARAAIVPVVLEGVYEVMPKSSLLLNAGKWKRRVVMQITPPVSTEGYTIETAIELQEKVREQMALVFEALKRERASSATQA